MRLDKYLEVNRGAARFLHLIKQKTSDPKYGIRDFIILRRVQDLNLRACYKTGSSDFESDALPLCQLSIDKVCIPYRPILN